MARNRKKPAEDDDGRVIAPMNVEGMPWYHPGRQERPQEPQDAQNDDSILPPRQEPLTREERRAFLGGVLKAALLVAAVFVLAYLAFILFCVKVWFR